MHYKNISVQVKEFEYTKIADLFNHVKHSILYKVL